MEKQQSALVELQSEMTTRQSELESATEGISQLESTIKSLRQDLETAQQKTDDTESRFGGIIKDKDAEISRLVEEAAAIPSLEAELEQQSLGIGDLERHLEESRERLGRLEEELATVTEDLARGDAGLSERDDRISELTAQLAAIPQERAETLAELEERDERITELEAQLYSAVQDQIESTAELHERDERIAQLESRLGLSGWQEPRYPDRDTAIVRMAEIAQRTRGSGPIVDDDLKLIHGVGPQLERLLKSLGITSFRQVANLQTDDIAYVSAALSAFPGRIERDNWMASAAEQHRKMYGEPP